MSEGYGDESLYGDLFGDGFEGMDAPDRAEGGGFVLPRFDYYTLIFEGMEARFGRDGSGTPALHFALRVINGPDGTIGKPVYDDFYVAIKREDRDGQMRSEAEFAKAKENLKLSFLRLRDHMKLEQVIPSGFSKEALLQWGSQFIGREAIFALSLQKARTDQVTGNEYDARNRIIWRSCAAPDAEVLDKRTKQPTGQTYADKSVEEIAKFEAKLTEAPGATKAGAFGSAAATSHFTR